MTERELADRLPQRPSCRRVAERGERRGREVARVERDRVLAGPRSGDQDRRALERGGLVVQDRLAEVERLLLVGGLLEAARGHQQGARGVHVGVGGRLRVRHLAVLPEEREQPVGAPDVVLGPAPDRVEALLVADRDGDQHPVGLPLADRVAALVEPLHAAVVGDVLVEEPLRGGIGLAGLCRRALDASSDGAARPAAADGQVRGTPRQREREQCDEQLTHRAAQAATSASSADSESGTRGFASAGQQPVIRIDTWTAAKQTLLSVAASWFLDQAVDADPDQYGHRHQRRHDGARLARRGALLRASPRTSPPCAARCRPWPGSGSRSWRRPARRPRTCTTPAPASAAVVSATAK